MLKLIIASALVALVCGDGWLAEPKKVERKNYVKYNKDYNYHHQLKQAGWYFAPQTQVSKEFGVWYKNADEYDENYGSFKKSSDVLVNPHETKVDKSEDGEHHTKETRHKAHPIPYPGAYRAAAQEAHIGYPWRAYNDHTGHHGNGHGYGYGGYPGYGYGNGHFRSDAKHGRHGYGYRHGGHKHGHGHGHKTHHRFAAGGKVNHKFDVNVAADTHTDGHYHGYNGYRGAW